MYKILCFAALAVLPSACLLSQDQPLDMKMDFEEYDPPSSLKVDEHKLTRAKFPFIDIHNHYGNMASTDLGERVKYMDQLNMAVMNNLSGRGFGNAPADVIPRTIENINKNFPGRFTIFTNIDFSGIDEPDWGAKTAKQVENDVKAGAKGLKIYKNLGIRSTDKN